MARPDSRSRYTLGLLLAALWASGLHANELSSLRLPGGSLVKAGDPKLRVLEQLGLPEAQQGGVFYYYVPQKGLVAFEFTADDRVRRMSDSR